MKKESEGGLGGKEAEGGVDLFAGRPGKAMVARQ